MSEHVSETVQFFGRLHPLLVHLPIGFLMLLALLEALAAHPRLKHVAAANRTILALSIPVALASVGCGWLLSRTADYDPQLLVWHKWTGTGLGVAVVLLGFLLRRGWVRAYRALLGVTVILLAVAGHFGGALTHGRNYLGVGPLQVLFGDASAAPPSRLTSGDVTTRPVYAAVIQPIFTENCISCHGPTKSKGRLRLDSLQRLLKGGENGPVIVPGEVSQSVLLQRVLLPLDNEDHMPPEGKHQLSETDLTLLQWWIRAGAPADKSLRELNPPDAIARVFALGNRTLP